MSSRNLTLATKTSRSSAVAIGLLLCASAHTAVAAGADSVDVFAAGAALDNYLREARVSAPALAQQRVRFDAIRHSTDDSGHVSFDGEVPPPVVLARLQNAFGSAPGLSSDRGRQGDHEVSLRNSDAAVRAKVELTLGNRWRGFVYADMGAADSALRGQGLAGIHGNHGLDLLGGWRHVTYRFSPGMGLDSLDFNGPFLGATLTW